MFFKQRRISVMGNPRSCSFSIGRGPRSTTWGTWRASTPPSWTSAPVGLHWAEHHRNSWVKSPYDLTHRNGWALHHDNPGLVQAQGQDIWWSIWIWWSLPNPPRTTTPPTTRTHTLEGEFSSSHIRFLLLLSIMSTFSVEVYPSLSSPTYPTEQNLQKALLAPPDKNHN